MTNTRTVQISKNVGRGNSLDMVPGHRRASEGKKLNKINSSYIKPRQTLAPLPKVKHGGPRGLHLMNQDG